MTDAAERLVFERAARLRDALQSLEGLAGRQQALLSAIDSLDLVAACPSSRREHLEFFLFSGGRFVEQRSVARESLADPEVALETARAVLRGRGRAAEIVGGEVEPELLDQLFIVSRWLRQNSGAGCHFLLPRDEETNFLALQLGAWLRDLVVSGELGPRDLGGAPIDAVSLVDEWEELPDESAPTTS
jgi:excinuclease ABC subunit C